LTHNNNGGVRTIGRYGSSDKNDRINESIHGNISGMHARVQDKRSSKIFTK